MSSFPGTEMRIMARSYPSRSVSDDEVSKLCVLSTTQASGAKKALAWGTVVQPMTRMKLATKAIPLCVLHTNDPPASTHAHVCSEQ